MSTVILVFWISTGAWFHETKLEFPNYTQCMHAHAALIDMAQVRFGETVIADGRCFP